MRVLARTDGDAGTSCATHGLGCRGRLQISAFRAPARRGTTLADAYTMRSTGIASLLGVSLSVLIFAAGCGCDAGGGDSSQSAVTTAPSTPASLDVQLGTGTGGFEPLVAGTTITEVHGPQGGQHVWTSLRLSDAGFDTAHVNLSARFADTGEPAGDASGWDIGLSTPMDGDRTYAGLRNYVAPLSAPRAVVLRLEIVAPDGRHGADERTVMLSP
jgi:hypothetical protein